MGFAPVNYSDMFDNINHLTNKKDIIRKLCITTNFSKKYITKLCGLASDYKGKTVWYLVDLEAFFGIRIRHVSPFFRPEFFIGGWDYNCYEEDNTIRDYVTACGLKKILLILALGTSIEDVDNGKHSQLCFKESNNLYQPEGDRI